MLIVAALFLSLYEKSVKMEVVLRQYRYFRLNYIFEKGN